MVGQGGFAVLSGLLVEQAETVLAAYTAGVQTGHREDIGDWATLTLTRI